MKAWTPLLDAVRQKIRMEEELTALREAEQAQDRELRALAAAEEAAQEALGKQKGFSGKGILSRLTGSYAADLEQRQAEVRRAGLALESARSRHGETIQKLRALEIELEAYAEADDACFRALVECGAGHPLLEQLRSAGEADAGLARKEARLHQAIDAADKLRQDLERAKTILIHHDRRSTTTGVLYDARFQSLDHQLPLCQQGMNGLLDLLDDVQEQVEVHRIRCYGGSAFTEPLTDFTLEDRLSDGIFQLTILQKQMLRLRGALSAERAAGLQTLRELMFQVGGA